MNPTRKDYYDMVNQMGKKEFTLLKMQEYGFWPEDLPTPYEKQKNETKEDYEERTKLLKEYEQIAEQIADLYEEKNKINDHLSELKKQYSQTWDLEKIRKDIASKIMQESIKRRAERKKQRELEKRERSERWKKEKEEHIVFIGKGYSSFLLDKQNNEERLLSLHLPIIQDDKDLARQLEMEYKELRFLVYHRDVVMQDHYYRYTIPKRSGGTRNIAAPKPLLKKAQRKILELILEKIKISDYAHGFLRGKSVISGADAHKKQPTLLINMDIENFFPTITFARVRGMFVSFGYSGYVSSLLAMLCTYCERMPIEIKGETKYIKTSERILPQGSPASPMITNILCRRLDEKMHLLSEENKVPFVYTRYADDMSFSFSDEMDQQEINKFFSVVQKNVQAEGFQINKKKTRCLRSHNRQCITGIVINNETLGVPKKWVKKMRSAVYNAEKLKEKGNLPLETKREISGMLSWLKAVNSERYQKIIKEASAVLRDGENS